MKAIIVIILFLEFIIINSEACHSGSIISDNQCFNNVIYFDKENKYYRASHFALNTKGDLIIEYSYNTSRLFYGLKKDGKYYFPEVTKEIEIISNNINYTSLGRYESVNSFISLKDDINKEKEYLLSISSYITILELHDFENNNYEIFESVKFFNSTLGIHSFVFQVLEKKIDNKNIYFLTYITPYPYILYLKMMQ